VRPLALPTLIALLALGADCSRSSAVAPECLRDDQCPADQACAGGTCIGRATPPASWGVELLPRSVDTTAGLTELVGITLTGNQVDLTASEKVTVSGTFVPEGTATPVTVGHVVLTVPAAIPGRPDILYETDLPASVNLVAGPPTFTLGIPRGVLGRTGTIQLLPSAPDDSTHAPALFPTTVAPSLQFTVSSKSISVRGRSLSALGDPKPGIIARAFQGGRLISNVDITAAAGTTAVGTFTLMALPPVTGNTAGMPMTIELAPPVDGPDAPRFTSSGFPPTAGKDFGDLKWPAFSQANSYRFAVHGDVADGPVVSGAVVRARTVLAEETAGTTDFLRDGKTDVAGLANLTLLPGTTAALRAYDIAVTPPPESDYGIKCLEKFPLAAGGAKEAPANVPPIVLPRRLVVSGTVRGDDGTPAKDVAILATRTAADAGIPCAATAGSPPGSATTDGSGTFKVSLDPGTYRFDYDPPTGSPFPRLTEIDVIVAASMERGVRLPAGALVEGTTRGPGGALLPLAGVRFFEVMCTGPANCSGPGRIEPLLRGQTRSDMSGHFRVVIPRP
jgi:hypothetical protein